MVTIEFNDKLNSDNGYTVKYCYRQDSSECRDRYEQTDEHEQRSKEMQKHRHFRMCSKAKKERNRK